MSKDDFLLFPVSKYIFISSVIQLYRKMTLMREEKCPIGVGAKSHNHRMIWVTRDL